MRKLSIRADIIIDSMFKLGEYNEEEGRGIADLLKQAGMKVDIRTFTSSNIEVFHYLEGRMSEIKEELDVERFNRYAKSLDALKRVLSRGVTSENFREEFHRELDPNVDEKRHLYGEIFEGCLSEEELDAKIQDSSKIFGDLIKISNAESFIDLVLERNDIEIGDPIGNRLDDPIIRIFADEENDDKSKLARTTTNFTVKPCVAIFIDEFSAIFSENLVEEFKEEYQDEYSRRVLLRKLMSELSEPAPSKMDMESFSHRCEFQMESNGDLLEIDGKYAAEELARFLEKNDIVKVKGDGIKWKR